MDLSDLEALKPSRVLRERFELEAALNGLPSPVGSQLESVKQRLLGPGHNGATHNGQEALQIRYMDLLMLSRDVNTEEAEVCRLRYLDLAMPESYEANRRLSDIQEGGGEEIIQTSVCDDKGEAMPGWVRVRGVRQRFASMDLVAAHMAAQGVLNGDGKPMSTGAVKRRHEDALAKVAETIRWKRFQMMTEGGHE